MAWQGANTNVNEAAGTALVPVVLTAPSAFTITVAYATSPGTATAGSDYTTASGTLTFAPSQTALNVSVPILNDATAEPNETVTLTLSSPTNATLGSPNPATLTIVDNDGGASGTDEFYQYDALGDLLQKGASAYTYGASASSCVAGTPASKPHAATSAGAASYSYDCDGNMLSGGTHAVIHWDTENRADSITTGGVPETYGYDADGERITRTSGGATTVYLGGLWEETSAGAVKQHYSFNGTVVAVRDSSAGISYLHADHLGSVSATTGTQAGGQTFGPWGNVTSGSSSATNRNYTGQYLDSASGLLYYHARYYDAILARFISADSVVPGQTNTNGAPNPQQLNRYSYVNNNPLTYNDPSGREADCGMGGGEACGGGGYDPTEGVEKPSAPERISEPAAETVAEPVMGSGGGGGGSWGEAAVVENPAAVAAREGATCGDCGTVRPDLVRDSGKVRVDDDGVSLRCRVCVAKGNTPLDPKEKYWTHSFDEYEQKAAEHGYGSPKYTPEHGTPPTGHFSAFEGAPTGSADETSPEVNTFIRGNKQRPQ